MTVGNRIQRRREELGLTQTELANKMGYAGKSAVSRAETSGDDIGANRIVKFANALDCTPAYLMGWEQEDKENTKDRINFYAETISSNIELQLLIEEAKDASQEDIRTVRTMLVALKNKDRKDCD